MKNKLVVFDLDETLIGGDSMMIWHQYLVDKGLVTDPEFLAEDDRLMELYAAGDLDMDEYLEFSLNPIAALSKTEVDSLAADCVKTRVMPLLFPQAKELLTQLEQDGSRVVIVSATVSFIVHQVARALGVEIAMGIDLEQDNGAYSPRVAGIATFREGKVHRLTRWIENLGHDFDHIGFYSDSINDLPMCLFADEVHVVNPCPKLFKKAGEYNWPVLNWG